MRTIPYGTIYATLFLICMTSCAPVPSRSIVSTRAVEGIYRSDDYIVYQMKNGDTAASLAERFLGDPELFWRIQEANNVFEPDRYVAIPLKPKNKGGIFTDGVQQIPVLCYHRFATQCDSALCISEEVFERQMKYLKDNGYRAITPEQMLAFLEYRQSLPRKSVMITIDDGYSSFYKGAFPVLKKYKLTATLFVYVNFVGISSQSLNWAQLRELKSRGLSIGSHSVMHSDLSQKDENESEDAYMRRLRHEIFDSKKIVDAKLDQDTFVFAYPFGRANAATMMMTRQAGYKLAMTVQRGGNPFYANPYCLQRDQILESDMNIFVQRLKTFQLLSLR